MSSDSDNLKGKRSILSVEQRCNIIERLRNGESGKVLAEEFKVSKQAISWIKKNQNEILKTKEVLENCAGDLNKKRYKKQEENILDQKLISWYNQRRSMGYLVPGSTLKKQAIIFNKRLNGKATFTASDGWLDKFRKRYGLKNKNIDGEKLPADLEGNKNFKEKLNHIKNAAKVSIDCIYNCDETGLYWKVLPTENLVRRNKKEAIGFKKPKNRATIMACANASGSHKIPLLVIGKSAQPRCFMGVTNISVHYTYQENCCMTRDIMRNWYSEIFLPEVKKHHDLDNNPGTNILLIMDNAACHPPAEEFNKLSPFCTVMFLPLNATSLIQPLNQGIIEIFKKRYRNDLMENILLEEKKNTGYNRFLNSFNFLDACNLCGIAWDEVSSTDVKNCWTKLIPIDSEGSSDIPPVSFIDNEAFYGLSSRIKAFSICSSEEIDRWLSIDEDDDGWQSLSDDDILAGRSQAERQEVEELSDEVAYCDQDWNPYDAGEEDDGPAFLEALSGLNTFIKWYQKHGDNEDDILKVFSKTRQKLVRDGINN